MKIKSTHTTFVFFSKNLELYMIYYMVKSNKKKNKLFLLLISKINFQTVAADAFFKSNYLFKILAIGIEYTFYFLFYFSLS